MSAKSGTLSELRSKARDPLSTLDLDEADKFVHAAVRSFATGVDCPLPPSGLTWAVRANAAGVLSLVLDVMGRSGHPIGAEATALRWGAVARHQRTLVDLGQVGESLDACDIPWATLKGPMLRSVVFAEKHSRDYADLDLLVPPSDFGRAVDHLVANGASIVPFDVSMGIADRTAELSMNLRHGTMLDLHWSPINRGRIRDRFSLSTDELLSHRTTTVIEGVGVSALQNTDLVLHVLLHACLNGCTDLRGLVDAQQCMNWIEVPEETFAARAADLGLSGVARVVLSRTADYVDSSIRSWVDAVGPATTWTRIVDSASKNRPPSAPSAGRTSGAPLFSSAAATTRASLRELSRGALRAGKRSTSEPSLRLRPVTPYDPEFRRWLALAEPTT